MQSETSLPTFKPLMDMLIGPVHMAVLDTVISLDLPDHIEKNGNPEELALQMHLDKDNLIYLLDAATAAGLMEKKTGSYANTPLSRSFLLRSSPTYLGEMLISLKQLQHRNLHRLTELVRSGRPELPPDKKLKDPEHWKRSARYLANYHRAGAADILADIVDELPGVENMHRMLDLGSGPGVIGLEILSRTPHMQGVLFDLPAVADVAREEIGKASMERRVEVIGGNYNDTSFGQGYNLVLSSLNLYYARNLTDFLKRVRQAMEPNGVFISFHEGLTHGRTRPSRTVLSRLSLVMEGQDMSFNQGEIADALLNAGFSRVHSRTIETPMGTFELDIAFRGADQGQRMEA